jgi:cellulose 1,4-beta-cellobiosidase
LCIVAASGNREWLLTPHTSQYGTNMRCLTFLSHNLLSRQASNGEVCCGAKKPEGNCEYLDSASSGTCEKGLNEYRKDYIDPLAVSVKKYCGKVPIVLVIEPDSIPNLVTNTDDPKCGSKATMTAYRTGIKYAVETLAAACPEAAQYLDGAHGGWLGWPNNLEKFTAEVRDLGIHPHLRGFTTNVANYQPVGVRCPSTGFCLNGQNKENPCCADPCGLSTQFNPGHSELNYASALADSMSKGIPGFAPKFVIDTSRNAQNPRSKCSNWCNVRGAGAGVKPTTKTGAPELVDAYHYVKTPGESDGCTEELPLGGKCPRFDSDCASIDSIGSKTGEPRAPEAGKWFDYQIKMLARNAHL